MAVLVAILIAPATLLLVPRTAYATHAEGVSVTTASTIAGATGVSYTIQFTIGMGNGSTTLGSGDVAITFPAGYNLASTTFAEAESTVGGAAIAGQYASFEIVGQSLRILDFTPVLADGTTFVLKFDGITNPSTAGNQTISLQVFNQTVGDLGNLNTNGAAFVTISAPALTSFEVTAVGGGAIATQQVGVPFQIQVGALDDSSDPFAVLDDADYAVEIAIVGDTTGATGVGSVTLDFSATPGTATHIITLTGPQLGEAITVTSVDAPGVMGVSNTFDVIVQPAPDPDPDPETDPADEVAPHDYIVEAGDTRVRVFDRRSFPLGPDGATGETKAPGGASLRVQIPAGALGDASGLRLEVAAVPEQPDLDRQAPSMGGADVFASFIVRLVDSQGAPVEATFAVPVTLTFTVPPEDMPAGLQEDALLLSFWNGSSWTFVPATIRLGADGSATLVTQATHFTLFQITGVPDDWGTFSPAPDSARLSLTVWQGGSLDVFESALSGAAGWVIVEGRWFSYIPGAPVLVNDPFQALFGDGVPRSTPLVVVR